MLYTERQLMIAILEQAIKDRDLTINILKEAIILLHGTGKAAKIFAAAGV